MSSTEQLFQIVLSIASKLGIDISNPHFLAAVESAVYNNFAYRDSKVPAWFLHALTAVDMREEIPQTAFSREKNDGNVDNFVCDICEALNVELEDEGEWYFIDFSALLMQMIVILMGDTYEVYYYGD